jgi:hypothetical protein
MLLESKFSAWIHAGIALYRANPLMLEAVFYDASHVGTPGFLAPGQITDASKQWLMEEFRGGVVRWGMATFPILANTATSLAVDGDPTSVAPPASGCFHIIPPMTAELTQLFQNEKIAVLTAFAQVPTQMPAITMRLEREQQAETFIGDNLRTLDDGQFTFALREHALTASYLFSIYAVNRDATLWLFAWLSTYMLQSTGQFASWGLYDVSFGGSDLDPVLQFLAERTYARHLLFTCTRIERAVTLYDPGEPITDVCVRICAAYAPYTAALPYPMP